MKSPNGRTISATYDACLVIDPRRSLQIITIDKKRQYQQECHDRMVYLRFHHARHRTVQTTSQSEELLPCTLPTLESSYDERPLCTSGTPLDVPSCGLHAR